MTDTPETLLVFIDSAREPAGYLRTKHLRSNQDFKGDEAGVVTVNIDGVQFDGRPLPAAGAYEAVLEVDSAAPGTVFTAYETVRITHFASVHADAGKACSVSFVARSWLNGAEWARRSLPTP